MTEKRAAGGAATADAEVRLRCQGADEAAALAAALEPENEGHVTTEVHGDVLLLRAEAASIGSVIATLDDAMRCVQAFYGIEEREQGPDV